MIAILLAACVGLPEQIDLPFFGSAGSDRAQDPNLPPLAWIDQSWVVLHAEEATLGPYAEKAGWVSLVMQRDYAAAARALGPEGKIPAARAHAELSYLYRQAALAAAEAWVGAYGDGGRRPSSGAEHVLTVSYAILGRLDSARAEAARFRGDDASGRWHRPWREWLSSDASWPPDLRELPFALPPPAPGALPDVTDLPHYTIVEADGAWRDAGDPGALVALALWHEVAAAAADGGAAAAMKVVRAGGRLPVEPVPALEGEIPPELMFGSDHLTPADAAFVAAVSGDGPAASLVGSWAGKSIVAWLASRALVSGKLDAPSLIQRVEALEEVLRVRADQRTDGRPLAHHRTFAAIGAVGVLRSLVIVADQLEDSRGAGALRAEVEKRSVRAAADPVGLLALAAADARLGASASARAKVDAQVGRYPSLAVVLYALDALAER